MKRYAVVTHPIEEQILKMHEGQILGKQPVHDLVSDYHWVRLDSTSILMIASYPISNHFHLDNHSKVSMLPHIGSTRTIHSHIHKHAKHKNKDSHINALKLGLGINETHTMEDLIEILTEKHGQLFAPSV